MRRPQWVRPEHQPSHPGIRYRLIYTDGRRFWGTLSHVPSAGGYILLIRDVSGEDIHITGPAEEGMKEVLEVLVRVGAATPISVDPRRRGELTGVMQAEH